MAKLHLHARCSNLVLLLLRFVLLVPYSVVAPVRSVFASGFCFLILYIERDLIDPSTLLYD